VTDRDSRLGLRALGVVLGAIAVAAVALSLCVGAVLWALDGTKLLDIGPTDGRPRLDPIAIPKTACAAVEIIHGEANRFQQLYSNAQFGPYVGDVGVPWSVQRQELEDAAGRFDFAIAVGASSFPPRIARHLSRTRDALDHGRDVLAATSKAEQLSRVTETFRDGQEQFGYASDLIGDPCAVPLRANSETLLPSSTPTPAAEPAR
jgi:hypothetical protein